MFDFMIKLELSWYNKLKKHLYNDKKESRDKYVNI